MSSAKIAFFRRWWVAVSTYNGGEQMCPQLHFISGFSHLSDGALSHTSKGNIIRHNSLQILSTLLFLQSFARDFEIRWAIQCFCRRFHSSLSSSRERLSLRFISYYSLTGFPKTNKDEFLFKSLQSLPSLKVERHQISGYETCLEGKCADSENLVKLLQAII